MDKYTKKKELADFIKNKREAMSPDFVGIDSFSRRRVKGLRREEVALLSGVSLSWYTWLEQGKDIQVSAEVLLSITRALRFTHQETRYVLELAGYSYSADLAPKPQVSTNHNLQNVLNSLNNSPAIALDDYWNIVASNQAARLVFSNNQKLHQDSANLIELIFLDQDYQNLFVDWKVKARELLAQFRFSFSKKIEDRQYNSFIESMREKSDYFKECWFQHGVQNESAFDKILIHPKLGLLSFQYSNYAFVDKNGREYQLFINIPLQENDTAEKIKRAMDETNSM